MDEPKDRVKEMVDGLEAVAPGLLDDVIAIASGSARFRVIRCRCNSPYCECGDRLENQ